MSIGYFGLNETTLELEVPFGLGANHLPAVRAGSCTYIYTLHHICICIYCTMSMSIYHVLAPCMQVNYQGSFNSRVARLLDLTQPDLGYAPPPTVPVVQGASPTRERHVSPPPHVCLARGPSDRPSDLV